MRRRIGKKIMNNFEFHFNSGTKICGMRKKNAGLVIDFGDGLFVEFLKNGDLHFFEKGEEKYGFLISPSMYFEN